MQNCMPGDFGLGPYAAMLLFGVGVVISTVVYNFYFLNITVEGAPLTFSAYFNGNARQHVLGILGGGLCTVGLLAASAAVASSTAAGVSLLLQILLPLLSVVLAWVAGATKWKELSISPAGRSALLAGFLCFAVSIGVFAYGFTVR
jgi:glucose uptake protein